MNEENQQINDLQTVSACMALETQVKQQGNMSLAHAIRERMYEISIANLTTEKACENFVANAEKKQRYDLAKKARCRVLDIVVQKRSDFAQLNDIQIACLKAVYSYEQVLKVKNGKRVSAHYTWRKINNHGIVNAVDQLVSQTQPSSGFNLLKKIGLEEYSFEAIVLKYPSAFSAMAQQNAVNRFQPVKVVSICLI